MLLLRRRPPAEAAPIIAAARTEILAGAAAISTTTVSELLVGERDPAGIERLRSALALLPAVPLTLEASENAGEMGSFLALSGASIPFPDLLIAATALWLEIPLLTWDGDFARAHATARRSRSSHAGVELWRALELHPASRVA